VALSPEESDAAVVLEAMDGAAGIALAPFTDELPAEGVDRDAALAALRAVTAGVTPEVALLVRSEAAPIRARAVSVLGRIGGPVARDALASAASRPVDSDPDETVLGLAVDALAQTGDPAAVPPLVSALQHSRRWSIRTAAAVALGRLRAASAVPALVAALREDDFAFVRSAAADALGEIGSGAAAGDLEAARTHDPEPRVREAASRAARRLRP